MAFTDAAQFSFFSHDTLSGQDFANTFGLYCHDATDPVTSGVLRDFLDSGWMDGAIEDYKQVLPNTAILQSVVARRCYDPQDPTDPAPEASRSVDAPGGRSSDQDLPPTMCAIIVGHADTASRRARSHKFMPPSTSSADLGDVDGWDPAADYLQNVRAFRATLENLLTSAGGGHAGGGAADMDLATYSLKSREQDLPNYLFRWTSIGSPVAYHWLRSRQRRG